MVAVGAAVNDMREAQSLMMPLMLLLMFPCAVAADFAQPELGVQHDRSASFRRSTRSPC